MDKVDEMLAQVRDLIDAAASQIDNMRGGTRQDAALLRVLDHLTSAVEELAKRNDPLSIEKGEAEAVKQ